MPVSFSARLTTASDVLFRVINDEAVLLKLKTEMYMGLDPVGTRMWSLLMESNSIEAAYNILLAEYEVDAAQLRRDLEEFVEKLLEQGLAEISPERADARDTSA
jgi:hypothetical protein